MAMIFNGLPTYSRPLENKAASQLDTPLKKIAADKYLALIKSAAIKQKIEPTPLLFNVFPPLIF